MLLQSRRKGPEKAPEEIYNAYPPLPLDPTKRQIRLLRLHRPSRRGPHSRTRNEEISADLEIASLDEDPTYEALSYTWGASEKGHSILLNDRYRLKITDNLHNALSRFRQRSEQPLMWVDAVCINQSSVTERNEQVAMMGDIYRCAMLVNIWLGEPSLSSLSLYHRTLQYEILSYGRFGILLHFREAWRHFRWERTQLALQLADTATWPKWYHRAWTLQEYALADDRVLCFGSIRANLRHFDTNYFAVGDLIQKLSNLNRHGTEPNVHTLLRSIHNVEATDSRDMIYCLLGMLDAETAQYIVPNYSLPYEAVFAQGTYAIIRADCSFRILEKYGRLRQPGTSTLPSWAIDFRRMTAALADERYADYYPPRARKSPPMTSPPMLSPVNSFASLQIEGACFDVASKIVNITAPVRPDDYVIFPMVERTIFAQQQALKDAKDREIAELVRELKSSSGNADGLVHSIVATTRNIGDLCFELAKIWVGHEPYKELEYRAGNFLQVEYAIRAPQELGTRNEEKLSTAMTRRGFLGIGPYGMEPGDSLVLSPGAELPFILRPIGDSWTFHGFAWVSGMMERCWKDVELEYKTYKII